jgi:hypothetical protein
VVGEARAVSALEGNDAGFLSRVRSHQRPLAIAGALLSLCGIAYLAWAILRYDPEADPRLDTGFDRPIAKLGFLFQRGLWLVENAQPQTPTEERLLHGLSRNMQFSAGIMVLLLRIFTGTLTTLAGFIVMTVVVERARLLKLIKRLQE